MKYSLLAAAFAYPLVACNPPTMAPLTAPPHPSPDAPAPTPEVVATASAPTPPALASPAVPVSAASGDFCADLRTATGAAMAQFAGWKQAEKPDSEGQGEAVFATRFVLPGARACHLIEWQDSYEGGLGVRYECDLAAPADAKAANQTADDWAAKVESCKLPNYLPHHVTGNETRFYVFSTEEGAGPNHEIAIQVIAASAFNAGGEAMPRRALLVVRRNVL